VEHIRQVFALVCSRAHCRVLGGEALPFCQRCTGLYVGAAVAVVLYAVFRPHSSSLSLWIHGLLLLLVVAFGYHLVPQNGMLRTLTGQLFAVGLVCYLSLLPASRLAFWKDGGTRASRAPYACSEGNVRCKDPHPVPEGEGTRHYRFPHSFSGPS